MLLVSMTSRPPCRMASRAFTARFIINLLDLRRIGKDRGQIGAGCHANLDILANYPPEQSHYVADSVIKVDYPFVQDAAGDRTPAVDESAQRRDCRPFLYLSGEVVRDRPDAVCGAQVCVAEDGCQEIVEVVSDTAGKCADSLQLVRLL